MLKNPTGKKSDTRLLSAAVGASILLHSAAIGGLIWWQSGQATGTARKSNGEREIQVKIQHPARLKKSEDPVNRKKPVSGAASYASAAEQSARAHSRSSPDSAVSARRLLDDPATGLIFSAYFKGVKVRLARSAQNPAYGLNRDVAVHFVLSRTGELEAVSTPPGTSPADQEAVRRLLAEAAPFAAFPPTIRHGSIAFDVLFRSDKNMLV